jgi:hypothetical protein
MKRECSQRLARGTATRICACTCINSVALYMRRNEPARHSRVCMVRVRAPPCARTGLFESRKRTLRVHLVGVARRGKAGATNADAPPTTATTSADLRTICTNTGHALISGLLRMLLPTSPTPSQRSVARPNPRPHNRLPPPFPHIPSLECVARMNSRVQPVTTTDLLNLHVFCIVNIFVTILFLYC